MGKKIILTFLNKHKFSYIIGIAFMLLTSYIQTLAPKVLGKAIDILKTEHFDFGDVKLQILYLLIITAGAFMTTYAWRNLVVVNARNLECYLREMLYNHFLSLSPEFYNTRKTGDLIAYAINDISAVRMTFGPAAAMTINGIVICILSIVSMAGSVNWYLTLMALLPVPLILFFMLNIGKLVQKRFKKVQENFAAISDRVQENIYGIRVIKSYVQEDKEVRNFEVLNSRMAESNINMVRISSFLSPLIELCFSVSFVLNLMIGGHMVLNESISLGSFVAFNGYLTMIMHPVLNIGRVITIFQRGMASLKRLNEIFDVEPRIKDGKRMLKEPIKGDIEIRGLDFTYPGANKTSLENISIKIPRGSTLGIVGKTGSGKSTIANLLLKLYNVDPHKIYLDNTDLNEYSLETLRNSFGFVPQDSFLFSAPIRDNIAFFKPAYTDAEIAEAAQASCIDEFIRSLPDGYDTILGERGVNLSGGQKQRISIARALVRNPEILILDDALSAVDAITEAQILENFKKLRKGKTTLIIAHRMSAVEHADEIIVLDEGRIIERGTHQKLMEEQGKYYETYLEQAKQDGPEII